MEINNTNEFNVANLRNFVVDAWNQARLGNRAVSKSPDDATTRKTSGIAEDALVSRQI